MENLEYLEDIISRMRKEVDKMNKAQFAKDITKSERILVQYVRELQLASPRVWEDVMAVSQNRRKELTES